MTDSGHDAAATPTSWMPTEWERLRDARIALLRRAIAQCEELWQHGRLRDPASRWEFTLLRRELALLQSAAAPPRSPNATDGGPRFLWRRAEVARVVASRLRTSSKWNRARSAQLRHRPRALQVIGD